ncbi:MAG: cupin domain-containing protein [Actinomycetota bacterium]|nr:cupin domain-containing protein [Actinomycetota bacterium]
MTNIFRPAFEEGERPEGFRSRRARIGYALGTELIGASLWEVPPGEAAYPYHFHYSDEELVIVLSGRPSLRTPDGVRELEEGEALRFPLGEEGAHQIFNDGEETATFLAISSSGRPDVIVYPDSDKIGFGERLPRGGGLRAFFRRGDRVDYFEGESRRPG